MVTLKNILVSTDFSEPSGVALAYGRDLARSYGATLHVLHVVEDVMLRYASEIGFVTPDLQEQIETTAAADLHALITEDDRNTLVVREAIERAVNPATAIVDYAKANAIDLIV